MSKVVVIGGYADSLIRFRGELLKTMVVNGHQVIASAPNAEPKTIQALNQLGVLFNEVFIDRAGLNPLKDLRTLRSLYQLHRQSMPDVVLQYTIKPVIFGSLAAKVAGVPTIYSLISGLGYAFSGGGWKKDLLALLAKGLYRWALRYNKKVFFQNPDNLEFFVRQNIVPRQKSVLVNGSGVDLKEFPFAEMPLEGVSFLLIARLIKDKGVLEYAQAAQVLKHKYPNVKFKLVGWIDRNNPSAVKEDELQGWIDGGYIEYLGHLDDVRPTIASSSVFVLPSYYPEGTPRTILESMAMGRPIITTDMPGCRETVTDGDNGFLIPARKVDSLVKVMERFISDRSLLARMGARSRAIAKEKYNVHKVNEVMLKSMKLL